MPNNEKEINVNLIRERQHVERIERVARKEGATIESILEAIEQEKAERLAREQEIMLARAKYNYLKEIKNEH